MNDDVYGYTGRGVTGQLATSLGSSAPKTGGSLPAFSQRFGGPYQTAAHNRPTTGYAPQTSYPSQVCFTKNAFNDSFNSLIENF